MLFFTKLNTNTIESLTSGKSINNDKGDIDKQETEDPRFGREAARHGKERRGYVRVVTGMDANALSFF